MKVVKLGDATIPAEMTELVNEAMATAFKIVPISIGKKDKSDHGGDGRAPEPLDTLDQPADRSWGSRSRGRSPPRRT